MKNSDLFNSINLKKGIAPYDHATGDTAVTSEIIDMQPNSSLTFAIATGSLARLLTLTCWALKRWRLRCLATTARCSRLGTRASSAMCA